MTLTREVAARYLGMKVAEVIGLVDAADGGTLVTTHDHRQTLIDADGKLHSQPAPVLLAVAPAPVTAPAAGVLVPSGHELVGESVSDVGRALADEFDLDPAAVEAFLAERFRAESIEPVGPGPEPLPQHVEDLPESQVIGAPAASLPAPDDETPVDEPGPGDDQVPDGNADVVIRWVGDDQARAQQALDVENSRPTPRGTVIAKLEKVVAAG